MFANDSTDKGNVKIYISDDRLIYKIYPYRLSTLENTVKKTRSKERQATSSEKLLLNTYAKKMSILGLGLCNPWQYFFTGTIDPKSYPANSFEDVAKLISSCFQRIKRKYGDTQYVFILEKHKNGNFHSHGLCNLPGTVINPFPKYIDSYGKVIRPSKSKFIQWGIDQNYYNIGLNTISPIQSRGSVTDYCLKYMVKMMSTGSKFSSSVFHSKGLKQFQIEYGNFIGDSFPSVLGINAHNNSLVIDNIYQYNIKYYGNIKEITLQLK